MSTDHQAGGLGPETVDVVVLTRDGSSPPAHVREAIAAQDGPGLETRLHVVAGSRRPGDSGRLHAIVRARNAGKRLGSAPWLMFVDDDVVLDLGCIAALVRGLLERPGYAALAADYRGESNAPAGPDGVPITAHVAMGATLFRREALAFVEFRTDGDRCECRCCSDDLRRAGFGIGYLPGASARHETGLRLRRRGAAATVPAGPSIAEAAYPPRVLTAFDRGHFARFRRQFLRTFRAAGNSETIIALAYGLYPSEIRVLEATPGVEVVALPNDELVVAARRLRDFQAVVARLPEDTPVAYWDAGDVLFQDRIAPLWDLVHANPDLLLAVREPKGHPENAAIAKWTLSITDPDARRHAYRLLTTTPCLNGGFAAGTARTMLRYLRGAHRIRHSTAMSGSLNRGDQTAMNLYCHAAPGRWREIPAGWNYCLYHRDAGDYGIDRNGRFFASDDTRIHVIHGNARTLMEPALSSLWDADFRADDSARAAGTSLGDRPHGHSERGTRTRPANRQGDPSPWGGRPTGMGARRVGRSAERPTVLFYCKVVFGAGHWVRSAALLAGLARRFRVVLALRGRLTDDLAVPPGVTVVPLPEATRDGASSLVGLFRRERPAAFLVEYFPFGRQEAADELLPVLELARGRTGPRPFVACSLRDVQHCRERRQGDYDAAVCAWIGRYFDAILVHSDPKVFSLGSTFARAEDLRAEVIHTGYVVPEGEAPRWSRDAHAPRIVVSVGGGRGGEGLLHAAVQAQRYAGLADEFTMRVFAGTYLDAVSWDTLRRAAGCTPRLELFRWVDDLRGELATAAVSVSRCGYNTALDLLRTRVPALVIPYGTSTEDEQTRRAVRLAGLGAIRWLPPDRLDPQVLADEIRRTVAFRPKAVPVDFDGVRRSVEVVAEGVLRGSELNTR